MYQNKRLYLSLESTLMEKRRGRGWGGLGLTRRALKPAVDHGLDAWGTSPLPTDPASFPESKRRPLVTGTPDTNTEFGAANSQPTLLSIALSQFSSFCAKGPTLRRVTNWPSQRKARARLPSASGISFGLILVRAFSVPDGFRRFSSSMSRRLAARNVYRSARCIEPQVHPRSGVSNTRFHRAWCSKAASKIKIPRAELSRLMRAKQFKN